MEQPKADPRVSPATSNAGGVLTAVATMRPLTQQEKDSSKHAEVKPTDVKPEVKAPEVPQKQPVVVPEVKPQVAPDKPQEEPQKAPEVDPEKKPEDQTKADPQTANKDYDWNKHATPEFFETGKLSEEALTEICSTFGLDRQAAEYTALGLAESIRRNTDEVLSAIGGKEVYSELTKWASSALTPEALKQFNEDVKTADVAKAKAAVTALKRQFVEANGSPKAEQQKLMQGTTTVSSQGANALSPFKSHEEFRGAMKDSRYRTDPAYTAEVHQKLLLAQRAGLIK